MGGLGTVLGLVSPRLLDRYAGFMGWIATLLLPLLAVALVHFFAAPGPVDVAGPAPAGPPRRPGRDGARGWNWTGIVPWLAGVATYQALTHLPWRWGATLPTLAVTAALALVGRRATRSQPSC